MATSHNNGVEVWLIRHHLTQQGGLYRREVWCQAYNGMCCCRHKFLASHDDADDGADGGGGVVDRMMRGIDGDNYAELARCFGLDNPANDGRSLDCLFFCTESIFDRIVNRRAWTVLRSLIPRLQMLPRDGIQLMRTLHKEFLRAPLTLDELYRDGCITPTTRLAACSYYVGGQRRPQPTCLYTPAFGDMHCHQLQIVLGHCAPRFPVHVLVNEVSTTQVRLPFVEMRMRASVQQQQQRQQQASAWTTDAALEHERLSLCMHTQLNSKRRLDRDEHDVLKRRLLFYRLYHEHGGRYRVTFANDDLKQLVLERYRPLVYQPLLLTSLARNAIVRAMCGAVDGGRLGEHASLASHVQTLSLPGRLAALLLSTDFCSLLEAARDALFPEDNGQDIAGYLQLDDQRRLRRAIAWTNGDGKDWEHEAHDNDDNDDNV